MPRRRFFNREPVESSSESDNDSETGDSEDGIKDNKRKTTKHAGRSDGRLSNGLKGIKNSEGLNTRSENSDTANSIRQNRPRISPADELAFLDRAFSNIPELSSNNSEKDKKKFQFSRKSVKLVSALLGIRRAVKSGDESCLGNLGFIPSNLKRGTSWRLENNDEKHFEASDQSNEPTDPTSFLANLQIDPLALQSSLASLKSALSAPPAVPYLLINPPLHLKPHEEAEISRFATALLPSYLVQATLDDLAWLVENHPSFRTGGGKPSTLVKRQLAELLGILGIARGGRTPDLPTGWNRPFSLPWESNCDNSTGNIVSISIFAFLAQLFLHSQIWHADERVGEKATVPCFLADGATEYPKWLTRFPDIIEHVAYDLLAVGLSKLGSWSRSDLAKLVATGWLSRPSLYFDLSFSIPCLPLPTTRPIRAPVPKITGLPLPIRAELSEGSSGFVGQTSSPRRKVGTLVSLSARASAELLAKLEIEALFSGPPERLGKTIGLMEELPEHLRKIVAGGLG